MVYYVPFLRVRESGETSAGYTLLESKPIKTSGDVQEFMEHIKQLDPNNPSLIIPLNFIPLNG